MKELFFFAFIVLLWLRVSVSPTCRICVTDRLRRQARSVQSVFRRNTRLSASAFASDAFWTVEPLMTTAALNRPLARGDFSRVHTEVPPDTGGPKHTRFITQLSTINYHHLKSPSHQYITKQIEKYYNYSLYFYGLHSGINAVHAYNRVEICKYIISVC